jgi:hypothetical protein
MTSPMMPPLRVAGAIYARPFSGHAGEADF